MFEQFIRDIFKAAGCLMLVAFVLFMATLASLFYIVITVVNQNG